MHFLRRVASSLSPDFAALAAIALLWNAPILLDPDRIVGHDTFAQFTVFHTFYSQWASGGGLVRWLPYCGFGMPATLWQIDMLTPSGCGFLALGSLLGIDDVLAVYACSCFFEVLTFLAGLFACSTRLFRDRRVRFLVCLMGLGTVGWHEQIYSCLRILYLDPWMVWCLLRFRDSGRSAWFWATGLLAILSVVGAPVYFAGLHLLALTCLGLPLAFGRWSLLVAIVRPSVRDVLAAVAFLLVASAVWTALHDAVAAVRLQDEHRGPDGRVTREVFLRHYSRDLGFVARSYVFGRNFRPELIYEPNLYVAAATWPLCVLAFWGRPRRDAVAMALPAVVLTGFALEDTVASVLYYFPLASYFRYRLSALGIANLYLTLWAGFGLVRLFEFDVVRRRRCVLIGGLATIGLLAAAVHLEHAADLFGSRVSESLDPPVLEHETQLVGNVGTGTSWARLALLALGPLAGLFVVRPRSCRASAAVFAVLVAWQFVDLSFHQYERLRYSRRIGEDEPALSDLCRVRPLEYRPQRIDAALRVKPRGARYNLQFQWEQVDPCRHDTELQVLSPLVAETLGGADRIAEGAAIRRIAGCDVPKLVFAEDVAVVDSWKAAREVLVARHAGTFVVEAQRAESRPATSRGEPPVLVAPEVLGFDANRLRCRFDAPTDGWLFYADAWSPDWTATVDGSPSDVRVANGCFKAVSIPRGPHEVLFEIGGRARIFARLVFGIGLAAFVPSLVAVGALFLRRIDPLTAPIAP